MCHAQEPPENRLYPFEVIHGVWAYRDDARAVFVVEHGVLYRRG